LMIREPLPQLEEAAEESVTMELSERMFIHPSRAERSLKSDMKVKPRPRTICEKYSAQVRVPMLMPSTTM
jgi:hypothetical protein